MPPRFTLGDTLAFSRALADYPASAGWVLHYRLLPRTGAGEAIAFDATASGSSHAVSVPAATTATWQAGTYSWTTWVTKDAASHTVEAGSVDLLPDPRTATGALDVRSAAQISLDNVRATIQGKATSDVLRYTIAGRQLEHYPMAELLQLETSLAGQVAAERRAAQLAAGRADTRRYTVRLGRG